MNEGAHIVTAVDDELGQIAEVAMATGVSAIIATNTTLSRDGLQSRHRDEAGGLSGAPLFEKSTRVLAQLAQLTDGKLPLIGGLLKPVPGLSIQRLTEHQFAAATTFFFP